MADEPIGYTNSASKPLRKKSKQLPYPLNLYQSAVGKKWVMAITGLMLLGFVISHMVGNLKLYIGIVEHNGSVDYDADIYAEFLRELLVPIFPETVFLWILRAGLLAAVTLHIHSFYSLTKMNMGSNTSYSSKRDWLASNFAARSMRYSGIIVFFYIIFHIADLTLGWIPGYEWQHGEVQSNVVGSLSNPVVAAFYIIANILLCIHIYHGAYSMFQSLGVSNPKYNYLRKIVATSLSAIILVGNVSFPIAVLAGVIEFNECEEDVTASVENNCVTEGDHSALGEIPGSLPEDDDGSLPEDDDRSLPEDDDRSKPEDDSYRGSVLKGES